jgi:hypothetical protein
LNRFPLLRHSHGMKEHQPMERPITLRLPSAVREKVEAEAVKDRRPLAAMVRILVEDGLVQRQSATQGQAA